MRDRYVGKSQSLKGTSNACRPFTFSEQSTHALSQMRANFVVREYPIESGKVSLATIHGLTREPHPDIIWSLNSRPDFPSEGLTNSFRAS